MSIDCDGAIYPCPIAFEQRISYGNLATSSLEEAWNSELYVATRAYLSRKGDVREDLPTLPCYNCRWYGKHHQRETIAPSASSDCRRLDPDRSRNRSRTRSNPVSCPNAGGRGKVRRVPP